MQKYKITYQELKTTTIIVEVKDNELNEEFNRLGNVNSNKDFTGDFDPRWQIEAIGFDKLQSGDVESEDEEIIDRKIEKI